LNYSPSFKTISILKRGLSFVKLFLEKISGTDDGRQRTEGRK